MIYFSSSPCAALVLFYAFCSPVFCLGQISVYLYVCMQIYYNNEVNHFFFEDLLHSLLVCVCVCVGGRAPAGAATVFQCTRRPQ